jgi:phosphoribosyl 1,2-cyclic phosphodiesterase
MKFCLLASGSSGNCTYVSAGETEILIDAGISLSRVSKELKELDVEPSNITAILITHEHTDHTKDLARVAHNLDCSVHITERTLARSRNAQKVHLEISTFKIKSAFEIGNLAISTFPVFHDAVEPCGFIISGPSETDANKTVTLGYATDLGAVTPPVMQAYSECDAIVVESNHDLEMLKSGPYPWDLKQRIRSPIGHLSNDDAAELINNLVEKGKLKVAALAHISTDNNKYDLALETAKSHLNGLFSCDIVLSYKNRRSELVVL